jgi:hypothetical protein
LKHWTTAHGHLLGMGGFTLVSDKIHQFKEPEQPEWLATPADWASYNVYVKQRQLCNLGTLTMKQFEELVRDPNIEFPPITPAQIQDRSKGDGLSKLLAILQTSWFILQCVARGFQGLALTELELVTLAMASLNAITYAFWWSKPLSVQEPVIVYVTVPAGAGKVDRSSESDDHFRGWNASFVFDVTEVDLQNSFGLIFNNRRHRKHLVRLPIRIFHILTYPVFVLFPLGIVLLLWVIKTDKVENAHDDESVATRVVVTLRKFRYRQTDSIRRYFIIEVLHKLSFVKPELSVYTHWFFLLPVNFILLLLLVLLLSPLFTVFIIASFTFTAAFEIVTTNSVYPGVTHVPAFYAPRTKSDKYSRMIVFAIFGAIFGIIHCIAWNFAFPTHSEMSLWRYTSLVLTVIPVVAAPMDYILENIDLKGRVGKKLRLLLGVSMTALFFLYVPSRLSLIVQALVLLRDQPAAAYIAVDWTKYIPHLFS